jgi:aldose sugar dehydrogenase
LDPRENAMYRLPLVFCLYLSALTAASSAFAQTTTIATQHGEVRVTPLVQNLANPWGMAFLPDQRILITERSGRLLIYANGQISDAVGEPSVWANGQGGLLDVAIDPNFSTNKLVYFTYAESDNSGRAGTAVARGVLNGNAVQNLQVIFRQLPKLSTGNHFGARLVFDKAGYLFVTLGENNERISAQYLDHHQGKVVRLHSDGSIPVDNPFVGQANIKPEIWSYGHRNPQGAALNPWTGKLWLNEHGPQGGDEINIPAAGKNYGWPIITYGVNYGGAPIPEAQGTEKSGMEQPIKYWVPSIATSGMAFFNGSKTHPWYGNVFVGGLAANQLVRLTLKGNVVVAEERINIGARVRDVRQGPDGYLYLLTDSNAGKLLKLRPPPRAFERFIKPPRPKPQERLD